MTRARLEAAVIGAMHRAARKPMEWGIDDCSLWCANAIREALGYDPAKKFRGKYRTRRGATRLLGRGWLKDAARAIVRRHKWKRINSAFAQPGDIGLTWALAPNGKPALATVMCRSRGWFVGRNENGYTAIPARDVPITWSVLDDCMIGSRVSLPRISRIPGAPPTSAVAHDPISDAIGLTALIAGFGASTAVASAIGGFLIAGAVSIGFSLAASLLSPQKNTSPSTYDSDQNETVQVTERQSLPSKRVIFGTQYVGGALFFEEVKPPYLYQGILINYGAMLGVDSIAIGTDTLVFNNVGEQLPENTILTPLPIIGQAAYNTHLRCSLRYGSSDQAIDPLLLSTFPEAFWSKSVALPWRLAT